METIPGMRVAENEGMPLLVSRCPFGTRPFPYDGLPFPINQSLFGAWPNVGVLLKNVKDAYSRNIYYVLDEALAIAECIESQSIDMTRRVLTAADIESLGRPPHGSEGGWVLLAGSGDRKAMADALGSIRARVFTLGIGLPGTHNLGGRDTAIVYFAQALLMRAMAAKAFEPGDIGALCDFMERRTPAAIVVTGATRPVEQLLIGSLLRLGVPAVTPPDFPFNCGRVAHGVKPAEVLEHLSHLPTARTALRKGTLVSLPQPASLDNIDEEFQPRYKFGGEDSFFHVTTGGRGDSAEVHGEVSQSLGVSIRLGSARLDAIMLSVIENRLAGLIDQLPGLRCRSVSPLVIEAARKDMLDGRMLADLIYAGARIHYNGIPSVQVLVTFDAKERAELAREAAQQRRKRDKELDSVREAGTDYFYSCAGCYSIRERHCCIVTPEHPPLCGLSWEALKTISELLPSPKASSAGEFRSFRPPVTPFRRGRNAGDKARGEYSGVNEAVAQATSGEVEKVWLHSLLVNPPTTSARFDVLLFNMRGVDGIGIADSDYQGLTPEGRSVRQLAYDATGMQRPGVRGVSYRYLFSPRFLEVDGGWSKVKWVNARLKEHLKRDGLTALRNAATEHDATTETQLKDYCARKHLSRIKAAAKAKDTKAAKAKRSASPTEADAKARPAKTKAADKTAGKRTATPKKATAKKSAKPAAQKAAKKTPKKTVKAPAKAVKKATKKSVKKASKAVKAAPAKKATPKKKTTKAKTAPRRKGSG